MLSQLLFGHFTAVKQEKGLSNAASWSLIFCCMKQAMETAVIRPIACLFSASCQKYINH